MAHIINNIEPLKAHTETILKTKIYWCSENGLKMNLDKTQCIIFATSKFNKRTEIFQLIIDRMAKHMEDKVKNLGGYLTFARYDCHTKSLCSRLSVTLSYLNRVKNTIDEKSRILLKMPLFSLI